MGGETAPIGGGIRPRGFTAVQDGDTGRVGGDINLPNGGDWPCAGERPMPGATGESVLPRDTGAGGDKVRGE